MVLYLNTPNDYGSLTIPKFDEITLIAHIKVERKLPMLKSWKWIVWYGDVVIVVWNDHDTYNNYIAPGCRVRNVNTGRTTYYIVTTGGRPGKYCFIGTGGVHGNNEMYVYACVDNSVRATVNLPSGYVVDFAGGVMKLIGGVPTFIKSMYIYSKVLTYDEFEDIIENPINPPTDGLECWLTFTEGKGNIVYDRSENNRNMTLTGCRWVVRKL